MRSVTRVVVNAECHVIPLAFAHGVARGKDWPLIADWRLGDVVEIATTVLGPFALQRPRRNRDFIVVRADNRVEHDPAAARRWLETLLVVKRRNHRTRFKTVIPAIRGTENLAPSLIADRRQPLRIREERAVLRQREVDA